MNENEIKESLRELVEAAATMGSEDLALIFIAPEFISPPDALGIVQEVTRRAGHSRIALYFGVDGHPAGWESTWGVEVTERWARKFVDECSEGLAGLVDEPMIRRMKGPDVDRFPGIGLVRLLVLAGYGETTKSVSPCGNTAIDVRLNDEGLLIATAVRQAKDAKEVS